MKIETICVCKNVALLRQDKKFFIKQDDELTELSVNDAHLVVKDFVSQVIYLGEGELNYELLKDFRL